MRRRDESGAVNQPPSNHNDIVVSGSFVPNEGNVISNSASLTSYCVEITRKIPAPKNSFVNRHDYGIGETMYVRQTPAVPQLTLTVVGGASSGSGQRRQVEWDIQDSVHSFAVSAGEDVEYHPFVRVFKPSGIRGCGAYTFTFGLPQGKAGGIKLKQYYRVLPDDVSFSNISVQEVPNDDVVELSGYFSHIPESDTEPRSHNRAAGAGKWADVDADNVVGSTLWTDNAGDGRELRRMTQEGFLTDDQSYGWLGGRNTWRIPFGWQRKGTPMESTIEPIGLFAEDTRQVMSITEDGTYRVEKLGHSSERRIDGKVFTDGREGFFGRD